MENINSILVNTILFITRTPDHTMPYKAHKNILKNKYYMFDTIHQYIFDQDSLWNGAEDN